MKESFYVDDGLMGAETVLDTISLQQQLHEAIERGRFTLHKWNSSDPLVLEHIPTELNDARVTQGISDVGNSGRWSRVRCYIRLFSPYHCRMATPGYYNKARFGDRHCENLKCHEMVLSHHN